MSASYEAVTRRFTEDDPRELSDRALAWEFNCEEEFIARVRREGGFKLFAARYRTVRERAEAKVRHHSVPVDGGHREWSGPRTKDGVPLVNVRGLTTTAGRIVFRMATGREPVGNVKASCTFPHCVAGAHVTDRPMREGLHAPILREVA